MEVMRQLGTLERTEISEEMKYRTQIEDLILSKSLQEFVDLRS
jgi:hypothetical protein